MLMLESLGIESICLPAKMYFLVSIIITIILIVTNKHPMRKFFNKEKIKATSGVGILLYSLYSILHLLFLALITLGFNHFCKLGYITGVGVIVTILLLLGVFHLLVQLILVPWAHEYVKNNK